MKSYTFAENFHTLYELAVTNYVKGQRDPAGLLPKTQVEFLAANGIRPQHMYDYAEDQIACGEPGYDNAFAIELVRRDYFLNVQRSCASTYVLDVTRLPEKTTAVRGIDWLPRLIPKAMAKLRGELPPSLMYCCGGDRRFFRAHDILPSEFLSVIWRLGDDTAAVIDWVANRRRAEQP